MRTLTLFILIFSASLKVYAREYVYLTAANLNLVVINAQLGNCGDSPIGITSDSADIDFIEETYNGIYCSLYATLADQREIETRVKFRIRNSAIPTQTPTLAQPLADSIKLSIPDDKLNNHEITLRDIIAEYRSLNVLHGFSFISGVTYYSARTKKGIKVTFSTKKVFAFGIDSLSYTRVNIESKYLD